MHDDDECDEYWTLHLASATAGRMPFVGLKGKASFAQGLDRSRLKLRS